MTSASAHRLTSKIINTEAQLRALIGGPAELTCAKISDRLNSMTRQFIARALRVHRHQRSPLTPCV